MPRRLFGRSLRLLAAALLCAPFILGLARSQPAGTGSVVIEAKIDDAIMPPVRDYLARALSRAEREHAGCLLIEMDTPGGRVDTMREIVQLFLMSKTPVVVYVAPSGARAGSAGAIIGLSAHVLAMAPGTNIGAAHPVNGSGTDIANDMREKIVNDTAAFARSVAEKRGKSVKIAEEFVRHSISLSESEALKQKVVDIVAQDRSDLLRQIDRRTVTTAAGPKTLHTLNARVDDEERTWGEAFLMFLFNPNVALVLGMLAAYGIIAEFNHPGAILPGVAGAICLILSLFSLSVLSVNAAGVSMLILSLALFIVDIYAPTHGVLTAGGVVAFVVGGLMLFNVNVSGVQASLAVIISLAAISALFFGGLMAAAIRIRRRPAGSGPETLIGETAQARTAITPTGKVFADGAFWNAVNIGDEPIDANDFVVVEARDGLTLKVRRADPQPAQPIYKSAHGETANT